jgi:hypothetical protein
MNIELGVTNYSQELLFDTSREHVSPRHALSPSSSA